jgi:two-component sensor histidine kinase
MSKWLSEFRRGWQGISEPSLVFNVGFSAFCLLGGTALRLLVSLFRPDSPFSLYLPAVVFASVFGGSRAGFATLFSGGVLGFIVAFRGTPVGTARIALLVIYLFIGAAIIWGVSHYRLIVRRQRESSRRLMREEAYRKLVVDELQHRLKNKTSTILAVVHQTLRDQPKAMAKLDGRIRALSAADHLINEADAKGCDIRELLVSELEPYGHVRFMLDGLPIYLPGKLAVSLALVFHELATNAAKYGAFSAPKGMLRVSWTLYDGFLNLVWDETEGPEVEPSNDSGFGMKLLKNALIPFAGSTDLQFLQTGLRCKIFCRLSETHQDLSTLNRPADKRV